jgi:hypothetical protein
MEQVVAVGARREAWARQRGHGIVLDTKWVDGTVGLMLRHAVTVTVTMMVKMDVEEITD